MNDTIMARLSIRIHLILCGLLFSISSYSTFPDKGRLYKTLDSLLSIQPQITQEKEERINFIREALKGPQVSDETRYQINLRLFDEYLAFRFDSAYKCIQECITIQERAGNQQQLQYCQLRLSHILAVTGLFNKARELLEGIDVNTLSPSNRIDYYNAKQEFFLFQSEQAMYTPYFDAYLDSALHYRELLLGQKDLDRYTEVFTRATYLGENGDIDQAILLLERYLPKEKDYRHYSIITSTLAYLYGKKGEIEPREEYLIRSAISDVSNSIRENNSLRELASLLMDQGETNRAFRYLHASSEDANFYGTRLRNMQSAQLSPNIINAYNRVLNRSRYITWALLFAISLVAIVLLISRLFRSRLIRQLKEANLQNKEINEQLSEANAKLSSLNTNLNTANEELSELGKVKEEYIGRLFELGSTLISKADERNKSLIRLLRNHKTEELYKEIKDTEYLHYLSENYLKHFDDAFLNICPNFVHEVNQLMAPDCQFTPRKGTLTTELRILALLRLGINNNQKIAEILNSSITTIYTYRSKIKARAINKDTFENDITSIEN